MPSLTLLCAGLLCAAAIMPAAHASPIESLRWKNRVALVFGSDNAQVEAQVESLLARARGLAEREMVVLRVEGDEASAAFGPALAMEAQALRDAYGVERRAPVTFILVGKDGTEKLRREEAVPVEEVFNLIDAMPMRRSETKR